YAGTEELASGPPACGRADRDSRRASGSGGDPDRLPVRKALPVRGRALHTGRAGAVGRWTRPSRRLPPGVRNAATAVCGRIIRDLGSFGRGQGTGNQGDFMKHYFAYG